MQVIVKLSFTFHCVSRSRDIALIWLQSDLGLSNVILIVFKFINGNRPCYLFSNVFDVFEFALEDNISLNE